MIGHKSNSHQATKLMRGAICMVLVASLLLTGVNRAAALPPDLPSSFFGSVTYSTSETPPAVGTLITASVPSGGGTTQVASTAIVTYNSSLVYSIDVPGDDPDTAGVKEGGVEGDAVTFMIGTRVVATGVWHKGTNVQLNIDPPTAAATNNGPVNEGSSATIDASGSLDAGADIASYSFDCANDGTFEIGPQAGATADCSFADGPSSQTVGIRVVDSKGGHGTTTTSVTVNNVAPTLSISGAASVAEGATYALTLSSTNDPGTDTITGWDITWASGVTEHIPGNPGSVTHVYPDGAANHTISATATDEDGTYTVPNTVAVTVTNVAPTLTISGAASVAEGATYTLNLSETDPGTDTITGWDITWTSGVTEHIPGNPGSVTHIYPDGAANHTISATATDEDGTYTASNTVAVTVTNVAPTLTISGAASVPEGTSYSLTLASTDPGTDTISAWDISWATGVTENIAGNPTSASHTYEVVGPTTISATATDEDGTFSSNTLSITVSDVLPTNVSAGGPYTGVTGSPVTLTASATCLAIDACTFAWDLDGDGFDDGAGQTIQHIWYATGSYNNVRVQVTDNEGNAVPSSPTTVTISSATHSIALVTGWNLISFNLRPTDTAIASVLSSMTGNYDLVYAWNAGTGRWSHYSPSAPSYANTLTTLDERQGFWIHVTTAGTLNVSGTSIQNNSIALTNTGGGWNLVGYPRAVNGNLPDILSSNGVTNFTLIYAWNGSAWSHYDPLQGTNTLTTITPGKGLWIKVTGNSSWTVNYP